jgi:hypothetical protein
MKKVLILVCALLLALPAAGFAGSASSLWDLTIGGNVKFDLGWNTGGAMGLLDTPVPVYRPTIPANIDTKYGNQLWGVGETGLTFFIKGPDTFGAKTNAFILGDFTGVWGASGSGTSETGPLTNYGTFDLAVARMEFVWPNTSLIIGQDMTVNNFYTNLFQAVSWNLGMGGKYPAPVTPEVLLTQKLTKEFNFQFGITEPWDGNSSQNAFNPAGPNTQTQFSRSTIPNFQGAVNYESDKCGKIGPWDLRFGLDGIYGQQRFTEFDTIGATGVPSGLTGTKDITVWQAMFKWMVPIIPAKGEDKTGGLLFDGDVWTSQGASAYNTNAGLLGNGSYVRPGQDIATPVMTGFLVNSQYWISDKLSLFGTWQYARANHSQWYAEATAPPPFVDVSPAWAGKSLHGTTLQLMYDVNPAVRFVLDWDECVQQYALGEPTLRNSAVVNSYRFAAYYFF